MVSGVKFWIGVGLSALLVALFFITVDLTYMLDALSQANYLYVAPAVGLYFISVAFRTLRWQLLLRHIKVVSVRRLFPVITVGYMANNLLPMRIGEVVRSYYLGEREGISKTSALTTIFVERVLDALTLLMFIAVVAAFVPLTEVAAGFSALSGVAPWLLTLTFSLPFIAAFGGMVLFALMPEQVRKFWRFVLRPLPNRFPHAQAHDIVEYFLQGLAQLRSPKTLALLFLTSVPIWGFETGLFFLIGFSFGFQDVYDSLWHLLAAVTLASALANIGGSVPSSPGGIGLFELITRETLVLLPLAVIDRPTAAAFAAVSHFALLLPMIVAGQVFLWVDNISLRRLTRQGTASASG